MNKPINSSLFTFQVMNFLEYTMRRLHKKEAPTPKLIIIDSITNKDVFSVLPLAIENNDIKLAVYNHNSLLEETMYLREFIGLIHLAAIDTLQDDSFFCMPVASLKEEYPYLYNTSSFTMTSQKEFNVSFLEYFRKALIYIDSTYNGRISFDAEDVVDFYKANDIKSYKAHLMYACVKLKKASYIAKLKTLVIDNDYDKQALHLYKTYLANKKGRTKLQNDINIILDSYAKFLYIVENDVEDYERLL